MSWIVLTALILLVGFAAIFAFCEWFVGRRRGPNDDDPSPAG